jgi:chromosome segregation ATPase
MLRDRIGSLENTVSQMTLQADALKASHRAKVDELEALLLVQRQKGFDEARRAETEADARIAAAKGDAQRRFDDLEKRYMDLRDAKERDQQQQRHHHDEVVHAMQQAFDADRAALKQHLEEAEDAHRDAEDRVQQLQELLEQSRTRRKKSEAESETLKSAAAEHTAQVEQLAAELGVAREAVIELSRQVTVLREQHATLQARAAYREEPSHHPDSAGSSDALSEWRRARGVTASAPTRPTPVQPATARNPTPTARGATPRRPQFVKVDSLVSPPLGSTQASFPSRPKR